jgi:hypothetical protein
MNRGRATDVVLSVSVARPPMATRPAELFPPLVWAGRKRYKASLLCVWAAGLAAEPTHEDLGWLVFLVVYYKRSEWLIRQIGLMDTGFNDSGRADARERSDSPSDLDHEAVMSMT